MAISEYIAHDVTERQAGPRGKVWLVGAGPGAPDLITVRGLRALQRAEVVIYDRLSAVELLDDAPCTALRIDVGKRSGNHTIPQDAINALLIEHAQAGRRVVRLKGGDPLVFGRGGEEALALAAAGIPFEFVPGISSALAVPTYDGIPVTQRGVAAAVTILTGHEGSAVDWAALARLGGTIVVLMGLAELPHITDRLIAHGLDADTPAAVIAHGTLPTQRSVHGTLSDIAQRAHDAHLTSPAITVVGAVASLHTLLAWYGIAGVHPGETC